MYMFNSNDIYSYLAKDGNPKEIYEALEKEIHDAQDRIAKEKDAELKKKEAEQKIEKARAAAFKALKSYVTLVNPDLDDIFISTALDPDWFLGFKTVPCNKDAQTPDWLLDLFKFV